MGLNANFNYDAQGNLLSGDGLSLTYNSFRQPTQVSRDGETIQYSYAADLQRVKESRSDLVTYEVDKVYEQSSDGSWRLYVEDIAIVGYQPQDGYSLAYTHRDRLGSAVTYTNEGGLVTARRQYDPFGKPRHWDGEMMDVAKLRHYMPIEGVNNLAISRKGFTDHRHMDEVQLIHMNGRVYDYNVGRFLSVDPIIQSPGNSQSINPYSYIMNNPLAGTDPSGYTAEEPEKRRQKVTVTGSKIKRDAPVGGTNTIGGSAVGVAYTGVGGAANGAKNTQGTVSGNATPTADIQGQGEISKNKDANPPSEVSYWGEFQSMWNKRLDQVTSAADRAVDYWIARDNPIMGTLAATMTKENIGNTTFTLTTGVFGGGLAGGIRQSYVNSMKQLSAFRTHLLASGYSERNVARMLVRGRNLIKDKFRGFRSNYHRPNYKELSQTRTDARIIENATKTNPGVNWMLGAK
ncbi:RHS repeat domain-containing protein [Bowmanella pacifica]|uniref:RHS repeat-associated core domain-containing protein n=1 Tax=Bowmanella pacifica TaxID=502051 RepID=A0A917YQQ4_9ALTE|nr:RHS repeat-associated core domain-containing protein [Bowmanella pacifica]GGO64095.1 hypothetical protein GCM10010982_02690 [Bowmanella pacifica]